MAAIETTYREALRQALIDAMHEDPSIIIMGEEVGRYGGAYGVTKGMLELFGENRIIDTPISEPGIVGAGIGAAMTGLRPVVELMYVDFAGLTMDQMANQAAKSRYMFGGQIGVPMVLRSQGRYGAIGGGTAFAIAGILVHPCARTSRGDAGNRERRLSSAAHGFDETRPRGVS